MKGHNNNGINKSSDDDDDAETDLQNIVQNAAQCYLEPCTHTHNVGTPHGQTARPASTVLLAL